MLGGLQSSKQMVVRQRELRQRSLFCRCGSGVPAIAGLCRRCYRARLHSQSCFGGQREAVLNRDEGRCVSCGAEKHGRSLHVHHRTRGVHEAAQLIALCASCHARVHRLGALRHWLPEFAVELWVEQHPGTPVQLQFPAPVMIQKFT